MNVNNSARKYCAAFFNIFNYSTGAEGVDFNPLTYLPPFSVIVHIHIDIYLYMHHTPFHGADFSQF